jgi:hypothetical protein
MKNVLEERFVSGRGDFDGVAAKDARDARTEQVRDNDLTWHQSALSLIEQCIPVGWKGTGEQLRIALLALGLPAPHHHNAWGSLVLNAQRRRLINKTGDMAHMETVRSHARMTPIIARVAS